MHTEFLAVALASALTGAGAQGAITQVAVEAPAGQTEVVVTVRGNNPCGAVTVDYGDGTKITHAIVALPTTFSHQYHKPGEHRVTAHGNGNCGGEVATSINVQPSHVRPAPAPPPAEARPAAPPLAAMEAIDLNGDGRITAAEWKGTSEVFGWIDRDGDDVLSREEIEGNAADVFTSLDVNGDRRLGPREWRTARTSFDRVDRNGDGFVTPAEFGVSPADLRRTASGRTLPGARGKAGSTLVVRAAEGWTDTGIAVRAGDLLTFTASGQIRLSTNADDVATAAGAKSGRLAPNAPVPDAPAGALIVRVGNSEPVFAGDGRPVRMPASGQLFLGINDDHVDDNNGMFRVTIAPAR